MSTPPIAESASSPHKKPLPTPPSKIKPKEDPSPDIIAKTKITSPTVQTEPNNLSFGFKN